MWKDSASRTTFHVGDEEPPVKKLRVENLASHESIPNTATSSYEPEIPQCLENKMENLLAFSSPLMKDEPPCKRRHVEHFMTAETFTETVDISDAHDTKFESPQRFHDDAVSPPTYRSSLLSKGTTQLNIGEPPSMRARVESFMPVTDTAEGHTEATVSSDRIIASSYDSLTILGLKVICNEKEICIPSEIKTKSKIIKVLTETFPDATDILGSVPLDFFTIEALQFKCKSLGLPTHSIKKKLIEQLESLN